MFFAVLLLPLYVAWHVQRQSKAKWLLSVQQQQQQVASSAAAAAAVAGTTAAPDTAVKQMGSSNIPVCSSSTQQQQQLGPDQQQQQQQQQRVTPCVVPAVPSAAVGGTSSRTLALVWQLGFMLVVSVALSEGIVLAISLNPDLRGLLWEKAVYYEYPA
jgi:hypothetical protein